MTPAPRRLSAGLFAEGSSDFVFLLPLLRRLLLDLCADAELVAVAEPIELRGQGETRRDKIADAVSRARAELDLVVVHADGKGQVDRVRREQVDPGAEAVRELDVPCVGAIPVKEMEAWTLCDGDALRHAFSTALDDATLGVPSRAAEVERISDPKEALNAIHRQVVGRRRTSRAVSFLPRLAEELSLARLRGVPAFAELERELRLVLEERGYLRPTQTPNG